MVLVCFLQILKGHMSAIMHVVITQHEHVFTFSKDMVGVNTSPLVLGSVLHSYIGWPHFRGSTMDLIYKMILNVKS